MHPSPLPAAALHGVLLLRKQNPYQPHSSAAELVAFTNRLFLKSRCMKSQEESVSVSVRSNAVIGEILFSMREE